MNGIGLLVLIATTAQIGSQPDPSRDFGWQIASDGVLEYIVQISPEKSTVMQSDHLENASDIPPELLGRASRFVVRIGKDVLPRTPTLQEIERRFPRYTSPSDVTAQLGPGGFSTVESDPVVNVQNPALPQLPSSLGGNLGQRANDTLSGLANSAQQTGSNMIDQAGELARSGMDALPLQGTGANPNRDGTGRDTVSLNDQFRMGASAGRTSPQASLTGPTPLPPNLPQTGSGGSTYPSTGFGGSANGASRFESTASVPRSAAGNLSSGAPTGLPGTSDWQTGSTSADPRLADARGNNLPYGATQNGGTAQQYDPRTPPSLGGTSLTGLPSQTTPTPNFGSSPGGNRFTNSGTNSGFNGTENSGFGTPGSGTSGYGNGGYGGSGYGGGGTYAGGNFNGNDPRLTGNGGSAVAYPGFNGGINAGAQSDVNRIASNPQTSQAGVPAATSNAGSTDSSPTDRSTATSNNNAETTTASPQSRATEGLLQIFFLLSLVVNFYLGMLIRKLLLRYRSLLTSVRAQTA